MRVIIAISLMVGLSGCEKLSDLLGEKPTTKTPEYVCSLPALKNLDYAQDPEQCESREKDWREIVIPRWKELSYGMRIAPDKWYSFKTLACDGLKVKSSKSEKCPVGSGK